MDKKIKKKKVRKPLDDFAQIKALVRKELRRMEKRLDELEGFAGIIEQTTTKIESGVGVLLSANELKQELDRVKEPDALQGEPKFKSGDIVKHVIDPYKYGIGTVTDMFTDDVGVKLADGSQRRHWAENVRPATSEETQAFQEAERVREWEGIAELQDGFWASTSADDCAELVALGLPLYSEETAKRDWFAMGWKDDKLAGFGKQSGDPEKKTTYANFLRMAQGTASRLRKEREAEVERKKEEERAKPLEQWAKVSWGDTTYYVLEKSPGHRNYYTIWRPGTTNTLDIDRAELTVL